LSLLLPNLLSLLLPNLLSLLLPNLLSLLLPNLLSLLLPNLLSLLLPNLLSPLLPNLSSPLLPSPLLKNQPRQLLKRPLCFVKRTFPRSMRLRLQNRKSPSAFLETRSLRNGRRRFINIRFAWNYALPSSRLGKTNSVLSRLFLPPRTLF
jgi:hypothetical protein